MDDPERAGDYSGPHPLIRNDQEDQAVYFLLPIHSGENMFDHATQGSGLHMVTSPPHSFRECEDGSLEIRASIGCGTQPYYWHGYLDEGNTWREI
jgi:hypothetical protein